MTKKSLLARLILSLLVTTAFIYLFIQYGDPGRYQQILASGDYRWLLSALILVPIIAIIRAWRLAVVLKLPLTMGLAGISILHNFLVAIAPMRSGELALPYLLRQHGNSDILEGLGVLLAVRIYDFLAVIFLGGLAATFTSLPNISDTVLSVSGVTISFLAVLLGSGLPLLARRIYALKFEILEHHPKILNGLKRVIQTLGQSNLKILFKMAVSSIIIWTLLLFIFFFTAKAYGLSLELAASIFAGCGALLASFFPISGLANFGPMQAAWAGILSWLEMPWTESLYSGLVAHLITILGISLLALGVYLFVSIRLTTPVRRDAKV
jgi:hypothetical protein